MSDVETNTEWSHILGKAKAGPLKGTQLERIPSDMATWASWKKQYTKTMVLDMSRTQRRYTAEIYKNIDRLVLGVVVRLEPYHFSYSQLKAKPIHNVTMGKEPFVVTYTVSSTSARVFSRKMDGNVLSFIQVAKAKEGDTKGADQTSLMMQDRQTDSIWNRSTGQAMAGKMKGKQLRHEVGIPSFTKAWSVFHPKSKTVE